MGKDVTDPRLSIEQRETLLDSYIKKEYNDYLEFKSGMDKEEE